MNFFKHDKNEGVIKRGFISFFDGLYIDETLNFPKAGGKEVPNTRDMQIHFVHVKTGSTHIQVTVYLTRPGLFIGVKGSVIEAFKSYLEQLCSMKVKIDIKEFDPFTSKIRGD